MIAENTLIGEIDGLDRMHSHGGSVTMPFHGLDLNLLIPIDASDGERSRTAAGLMGSSDDKRFASRRPQFAKPHTPADVPCWSNELPHSAWKVSLHRAPITGATVMAKRGYAQLENGITEAVLPRLPSLNFYKATETLWNELLNGRTNPKTG